MREYGTVKTAFWTDPLIASLPRDAKLLALYLLTSPHTNALGCFRVPIPYIAADIGESPEWVRKAMSHLTVSKRFAYCSQTGWIWIVNYLRHNPPANQNVYRKCQKELAGVPATVPFRAAVSECLGTSWDDFRNGSQTVSKPFGNGMANRSQTPEPEPEQEPEPAPPPSTPYSPPSPSPPSAGEVSKSVTKAEAGYPPEFETFWQEYPRRKGKGQALKAYLTARKRAPPAVILEGARRFAAECAHKEPQYVPYPSTWLNGDRWKDEPDHEYTRTIDADRIDAILNGRDPETGHETGSDIRPALERPGDAGED